MEMSDLAASCSAPAGSNSDPLFPECHPHSDSPAVLRKIYVSFRHSGTADNTVPSSKTKTAETSGMNPRTVMQIIVIVWAGCSGIYGVYKLPGGYVVRHELKRWCMPVPDKSLEMNYRNLCRRLKISHPPKLRMNTKLSPPLLAGLFRPCIFLPSDQYSWKELELLLSHELNHYKHHDLWCKLILQLVCIIYWFIPMLHLMRRKADQDLEFLCDERVIRDGAHEERMQYN